MRSEVYRYSGKGVDIVVTRDPDAYKKKYLWGVAIIPKKPGTIYLTDEEFGVLLRARMLCDEYRYPQSEGYEGAKMTATFFRLIADTYEMPWQGQQEGDVVKKCSKKAVDTSWFAG